MPLPLIEQRPRTHTLRIEVPLDLTGYEGHLTDEVDPVMSAMRICLSLSQAAYRGRICGEPQVDILKAPYAEQVDMTIVAVASDGMVKDVLRAED